MKAHKNEGGLEAASADAVERREEAARAHRAYIEARYRHAAGQLQQTHTLGNLRRARARAQTALARSIASVGQEA